MQKLFADYAESQAFSILAFPCNQFGGQEPWPNEQIKRFVRKEFKVKFDLFSKIDINGNEAHPLFRFIRSIHRDLYGSNFKWNFTKVIVDRQGIPVKRFAPNKEPLDIIPDLQPYFKT